MSRSTTPTTLLESLQQLGFSQYEARCYAGLLQPEPQTGYAVAKATGVPQPKVYEALRKLVSRGAAYELTGSPTRFLAVPPESLLDALEAEVDEHLATARRAAQELAPSTSATIEAVPTYKDWALVVSAARRAIDSAARRVYVSGSSAQLKDVSDSLKAALDRDVDVVLLCFGTVPFEDERLTLFRHLSTEGVIYRSHQARHLAVIVDSETAVWALANDGRTWSALETTNPLVIAALKGFIRHDIDMQQVFDDFGPALVERYGPGLEALERYRQPAPAAASGAPAKAPRRRRDAG